MASVFPSFWRTASIEEKTNAFIADARRAHGQKYDYSRVKYLTARRPVTIICPKHGPFRQWPWNHSGKPKCGCPKCATETAATKLVGRAASTFVDRLRAVHGRRFILKNVVYRDSRTKVRVGCRKHGDFLILPTNVLKGQGCKHCGKKKLSLRRMLPAEEFVRRARELHGKKYDYSKALYKGGRSPVYVICRRHGGWWQRAETHLNGAGCKACTKEAQLKQLTFSHSEFLRRARKKHGSKYSYVGRYKNSTSKVAIECPTHGVFRQLASSHMLGRGCRKCAFAAAGLRIKSSHKQFIAKARAVHGRKYSFPEKYRAARHPIKVRCRDHGIFKTTPNNLLRNHGCPICSESHGERLVATAFKKWGIVFRRQFSFKDCRDKKPLRFDFWLPRQKALVEFDGKQHFEPVERFGGDSHFKIVRRRDQIKKAYARKNGIRLIRIRYSVKSVEAFLVQKLGLKKSRLDKRC
jgi:very-short-patch-repair endonuclease